MRALGLFSFQLQNLGTSLLATHPNSGPHTEEEQFPRIPIGSSSAWRASRAPTLGAGPRESRARRRHRQKCLRHRQKCLRPRRALRLYGNSSGLAAPPSCAGAEPLPAKRSPAERFLERLYGETRLCRIRSRPGGSAEPEVPAFAS